ncbi:MAG: pentapeptide repeat-containing protein [Candidatus Thiothrix singaporensis]|uniref:Pentapeptide repeat-containing protein n=1 Tax=Candidatus Thiothrix singaporensis TaxID=2799669 RepID=A0A7L6APC3_9GAMM|nr:MAG: pentapeptide repeat-containing protein [Candidatus Thiothrix singaporensis]
MYGIDFSNREVLNATFENCDFAGANLSYLTARNWKIKDCVFKKCQLHNVKVNSPQIYDSIISISSNEDMHLNFADCSQLELSIDYTGLIEFTGGRLNGGVIETKTIHLI